MENDIVFLFNGCFESRLSVVEINERKYFAEKFEGFVIANKHARFTYDILFSNIYKN